MLNGDIALEHGHIGICHQHRFMVINKVRLQQGLINLAFGIEKSLQVGLVQRAQIQGSAQLDKRLDREERDIRLKMPPLIGAGDEAGFISEMPVAGFDLFKVVQRGLQQ